MNKSNVTKILSFTIIILSVGSLTGCASIVDGTHENVMVITTPVTDAHCTLTNSKGEWYVNSTPGSVEVHRDFNPL